MINSRPCSGKHRVRRLLASGLILAVTGALAAEPCPWEKSAEHTKLCGQWNALAERLEAAEQRARAAEARLQAVLGVEAPGETVLEPATGPEAARSRRIVRDVLDSLGKSVLDLGKLETDPDMVLTQEGDGHRAIFATAAWRLASTRVDFSPLELVVEPLDDTLARVVVRLGEVITVRRDDQLVARLTIGSQETEGIWNEEIEGFTEANLTLKKLGLRLTGEPVSGKIGRFHLNHSLGRLDDDTWSGQQTLGFNELTLRDETADLTLSLSHGSGRLGMNGQMMDGRTESQSDDQSGSPGEPPPDGAASQAQPSDSTAELSRLSRQVDALLSRLEANLALINLDIQRGGQPLAKLARMSAATRLEEKPDSGSTFHLTLALDGLQPLQSALPAELMPIAGQLQLGVLDIPPGYLTRMVEIGLAAEQIQDEQARQAYWRRESTLLLSDTPMSLTVQDSFIATPKARADLTIRAALDPVAALGGKGDLTLRIEALQSIIDDSNAAEQPGLASLLALLTIFSERSEAAGRVVDNYRIRVTEDGKLWLNGKDVSALFLPPRNRP